LSLVRRSFGPSPSESRETVADAGYREEVLGPQLLKVERQLLMQATRRKFWALNF
jgi:hypothetical protein